MIRHNILDNEEAAEKFFKAVWLIKDPEKSPWPGQEDFKLSVYDYFVFWHHRAMMFSTPPGQTRRNAAHSGPVFLPWHRYFLIRLEKFMAEALEDEDFRLPYWDWAADAENLEDPKTSRIWTSDYLGQFLHEDWEIRFDQNSFGNNPYPRINPRPLRRFLGEWPRGKMGTSNELSLMVRNEPVYDEEDYDEKVRKFRNLLEGWRGRNRFHNNVHLWVGGRSEDEDGDWIYGDMILSTSPNDPAFFLHHCFVDRVWAIWQNEHPTSKYVPDENAPDEYRFHRLKDRMYTFFDEEVTPEEMLNYRDYYEYDDLDFYRLL